MKNHKDKEDKFLDKAIDFAKQLFAGVLRSRTGSMTEIAKLLRFQTGTKGFDRMYAKILPIINEIKETFKKVLLENLPKEGLRLAIIDDTGIKKTGKHFPKQQTHHDSSSNTFYSGMKVLSSAIYQNGKLAVVDSTIVGKNDNKLDVATQKVDMLIAEYFAEIFLFDAWYCKNKLLEHIQKREKLFISRARKDTKTELDDDQERLDALFKNTSHKDYEQIRINGKSYWIIDAEMDFKAYGKLRIIISKEGLHDEPIFLLTNAYNFKASFIVKLYMKRFCIEVFFKDAKQFLNFETFLCRKENKWDMHLLLTNILHFGIQLKKSISKIVRSIRECIDKCLLFIKQNERFQKFFDELRKRCQT